MSVYTKTSPPHISAEKSIPNFYWKLILALFPVVFIACLIFQGDALRLILTSLLGVVLAEWGGHVLLGRNFNFWNGSSIFSALLFSMMLPPSAPTLFVFSAIFLATFFVRELFGGLGHSLIDPALFGRVILGIFSLQDASTKIYPLEYNLISRSLFSLENSLSHFLSDNILSLVASISNSLGTVSWFFILMMGCFLLVKKIQRVEIILIYLIAFIISQKAFHHGSLDILFIPQVLFTAFFLFIDPVSTPSSKKGMRFFVLIAGILAGALISNYENYFFVVSVAILFASFLSPWFDRLCSPKGKKVKV